MRNAIQHARHHIITGNQQNKAKWHEWTEEETTTTRDCRIRTLQKHNPWKEEDGEECNTDKQPLEEQKEQKNKHNK